MTELGFDILPGDHPIVPVMIGDAALAGRMAERDARARRLRDRFSYPVVPQGQARIRTQMSAAHSHRRHRPRDRGVRGGPRRHRVGPLHAGATQPGRPDRLRPRPRLHGHVRVLRRHRRRRVDPRRSAARSTSASRSSTPPTCTARATTSSWSAARSPTAATRSQLATKFGIRRDDDGRRWIDNRPEWIHQACDASLRRLGVGPHRPLLHAPPQPGRSDRGERRRDGRAGAGRARCGTWACPR